MSRNPLLHHKQRLSNYHRHGMVVEQFYEWLHWATERVSCSLHVHPKSLLSIQNGVPPYIFSHGLSLGTQRKESRLILCLANVAFIGSNLRNGSFNFSEENDSMENHRPPLPGTTFRNSPIIGNGDPPRQNRMRRACPHLPLIIQRSWRTYQNAAITAHLQNTSQFSTCFKGFKLIEYKHIMHISTKN